MSPISFSKSASTVAVSSLVLLLFGCGQKPDSQASSDNSNTIMPEELTDSQKTHITLGYSIGADLMLDTYSKDEAARILEGLRLASEGNEPEYVKELKSDAFQIMNDKRTQAQAALQESAVTDNKKAGEAFLATIDGKDGVVKTASGLRYEILNAGSETFATASDSVNVHYHGTLIDGTVFDSSVDRGEPVTFPLNGVIKGFSEGLTLVGEGGKIRLYMPSDIAYGDRGAGGAIGPGATLIFEVEVLKINP